MDQIMTVIRDESESTFDPDWDYISYYNWTGTPGALQPIVPNGGNGEPKMANGLVATSHRPSDDLCVFSQCPRQVFEILEADQAGFHTPDNAMLSAELANIAKVLDSANQLPAVSSLAKSYSASIRAAVLANTTTPQGIYAYELNGYGSFYIMDDANVPSLVSLPYLGFLDRNDEKYKKTKDALFSRMNPYYVEGKQFNGIG